jgi:hypothetical protein
MTEPNRKNRERTKPFMEHPTGQFATAVDAMANAIQRLRLIPEWNSWITFCAQGAGQHENSYHLAEIRMRRESINPGILIDVDLVARAAQVEKSCIVRTDHLYELLGTTPLEVARIFDAIFRGHHGIRPHVDEGDDYAIGAEW